MKKRIKKKEVENMANELLKQVGTAAIYVLAGVIIWLLSKVGNLNLSLGDIAVLIVIVTGAGYIGYALLKYFTGASVSDLDQLRDIIQKLLDIMKGEDEPSGSPESNPT